MALKNTHDLPPYGFQCYVPETNWKSTAYTGLEATVLEIQRHRQANPRFGWATDKGSIEKWVLAFTEARLRQMAGGEQWLVGPSESPPPDFTFPRRVPQSRPGVSGPVAEVAKKAVAGIALIADWLGSGLKPVEQALADARASVCARCVINQKPTEPFTSVVADGLHKLMEAKAHMKLSTPHDALLETCTACLCRNSLKVWVPIDHVKAHTTAKIFTALVEPCWIRNELAGSEPLS